MPADRYGLPLCSPSAAACAHYIAGIDRMLSYQPGADTELQAALADDPAFSMAHAALARHYQIWGRTADARTCMAQAQAHSAGISRRELQHVQVLATLMDGRPTEALGLLHEHLQDHPLDAMVLATALGAFGMLAFSGRPDHDGVRLALCERLAPAYGDDWWFLGNLAWCHIEAGSLQMGERLIEQSLELKPDNGNAIHVYAHLAYEQGRAAAPDVLARLDELSAGYGLHGMLHNHIRWHVALGALAAGRYDEVLATYDRHLAPDVATAPPINALTDAVSLLWRTDAAAGKPCCETRWQALYEFVKTRNYQPTVAFLDVHIAALYAAAGEQAAFDSLLSQLEAALAAGRLPAGAGVLALCQALRSYVTADSATTTSLIDNHLGEIVRLGGSGAQRDLFEDTLSAAHARMGNTPAAERAAVWRRVRGSSVTRV